MKKAIYVNTELKQKQVFQKYGAKVPLYQVYSIKDKFFNSSLYFEMHEPNTEVI